MQRPIRSWSDPAWSATDDPYRLIRSMTVAMLLEVVGAALVLVLVVGAFVVLSLVLGQP